MTTLSQDTSHEAERVQIDLFRQAAPSHKMQMVAEMNRALRVLALSGLRERHPDATPEALRRRLADLLLGAELAEQVYGKPSYAAETPG